jgi:hypothetical protein
MAESPQRWLQGLHVAGSIASVTGLSLLALNKALVCVAIGEILGWVISSSVLLAVLTISIMAMRTGATAIGERVGALGLAAFWLLATPFAVVVLLLLFGVVREVVVPFVILIVHGRYPLTECP